MILFPNYQVDRLVLEDCVGAPQVHEYQSHHTRNLLDWLGGERCDVSEDGAGAKAAQPRVGAAVEMTCHEKRDASTSQREEISARILTKLG
eukprot:CAMPEP_0205899012 /NCGR_PEP_ID=MMETSP1083-20121108/26373_1 /ASSEMBLY_ACC=CAM_ASM_000430 /TAXON_ID=97485 /ORGANISM="Prymnesium parvum, Strain Texoma1" /LENGTH=90 /DNA_ID=CAMNT_0053264349 /DNA_START=472 /DNA_END=745 /DNA_ORIENTATION=+